MSEILDNHFEPKAVHDHFMELTKLSHPSGKEDEVRKYVITCAQNIENVEISYYEPDSKDPGKRVIVLHRKGSEDYIDVPYITLQAHMDMICYPDEKIFPLHVFGYFDKGSKWIKAGSEENILLPERGTTLGADNGIGVAIILALLKDEILKDYPIECFFTVQEETDMGGVAAFDEKLLKGRKYINLDAGNAEAIVCGSAGECTIQYVGEVTLLPIPDNFTTLELSISGLVGGNSGSNINNGRLNAIKVITETLIRLNKRLTNLDGVIGKGIANYDLRLISMNSLTDQEIEKKK